MLKLTVFALICAVLVAAGSVVGQAPTPTAPSAGPAVQPNAQPAPPQNAQQFLNNLVGQVGNKDPRIRFAVREGLVAMGAQATPVLTAAKATHADPHVKAFIDRTLKRVKAMAKRKGRSAMFFSMNRGRDIDRIAMELNLGWEQMAKLGPVFKKFDRDAKDLYAAMREEGGFRDSEAWKDLREEMKLMREEAEPKLSEFLDEKQTKGAMRYMSGAGGGMPITFGTDLGSIRIIEGGPGSMRVTIKKPEKPEEGAAPEGKGK